jgi:hypothetical protein
MGDSGVGTGAVERCVALEGPGSTFTCPLLCSVLGRGRSGVGRAGEMKPSVIEEADRDEIKRAMLENLTGVRKRERLAARQKARAAGGPILFEDLYGIHAFSDAGIAERCN